MLSKFGLTIVEYNTKLNPCLAPEGITIDFGFDLFKNSISFSKETNIALLKLFCTQNVFLCSEFLNTSEKSMSLGPTSIFCKSSPVRSSLQSRLSVCEEG